MKVIDEPQVFLIGETKVNEDGLKGLLEYVGAPDWETDAPSDVERVVEVMGRICYRSFKPGLNPNVTRVREGNDTYISHVVDVGHGSVFEHGYVNFIFAGVSRVFTHELVRHRAGVAISQESLRFVRLSELSFWKPLVMMDPDVLVVEESEEALKIFTNTVEYLEKQQSELARVLKMDTRKSFKEKKKLTSAMRRIAPIGLATNIGWSANMRTLRHVLEMRTAPEAEEEIRLVFGKVGNILKKRYPNLFADYSVENVDGLPYFKTEHRKV